MKRLSLYILTGLLTFSIGALIFVLRTYKAINPQEVNIKVQPLNTPCAPEVLTLRPQPETTLQLSIIEANCNGSSWNARLRLQNLDTKGVTAYDVANVECYEYRAGGESSLGESTLGGMVLAPGESKDLTFGAGFRNGLSYGKPTGSIKRNVFWIKRVEYVDGSVWQAEPAIKRDRPNTSFQPTRR